MYGISGIKERDKTGNNLDKKIERLLKEGYLVNLKKGWYVSKPFLDKQSNLKSFTEYLANKLRTPSYLSLEYVLSKYNLIPEEINIWTSVTTKSTRFYENDLGVFSYKSIKDKLFMGYKETEVEGNQIYIANKTKALFDFLYLKRNLGENLVYELNEGLRFNWTVFSDKDLQEFSKYVQISNMDKMKQILKEIIKIKNAAG